MWHRSLRNPCATGSREKAPAWAPAWAIRSLVGVGDEVRPCRIGWPGEIAACARSRQPAGWSVILHRTGTESSGVRIRPLPGSASVTALTFRSRAMGRGNGAERNENRRFEGRQARNRDESGDLNRELETTATTPSCVRVRSFDQRRGAHMNGRALSARAIRASSVRPGLPPARARVEGRNRRAAATPD